MAVSSPKCQFPAPPSLHTQQRPKKNREIAGARNRHHWAQAFQCVCKVRSRTSVGRARQSHHGSLGIIWTTMIPGSRGIGGVSQWRFPWCRFFPNTFWYRIFISDLLEQVLKELLKLEVHRNMEIARSRAEKSEKKKEVKHHETSEQLFVMNFLIQEKGATNGKT